MARTASELTPWEIINVQELNDIANSKYVYKDSSGVFIWADITPLSWYTVTNVTTDRAYDANSTTIDELADVLWTLIGDISIISGWVQWNATASGTTGVGLTLTKQSGATYNLDLQTDYDGSPSMRLYRNAIWTTNTFANIDFNSKLDDGTANKNFVTIYWYTISQASSASYNWGLAYLFTNSGSGNYKFGMDYLWRFSVGDYAWDATEGGTNWLLFSSGTAATISNATRGYLYNNSGTLTWVNSGSDNQFSLNIPASALWIIGETITVNNTQSNAQTWLKVDVWTSTLDHNTLYLTGTRHSVYIGNADQAPAVTTNKLYSVWGNLFWNGTQLN